MDTKIPLIFLIFGASGSGKSTLVAELKNTKPLVTIHTKGTDREDRQYDGNEILCRKDISPDEYDYIYSQYGNRYGIQRKQIDNALRQGKHHIIICNDVDTIDAIKSDYTGLVRVIFLLYDAPREIILAIQKSRRISDDEIDLRVQKIHYFNQIFLDHCEIFDAVIINKFGEPQRKMFNQMNRIIVAEEDPQTSQSEKEIQTRVMDVLETTLQIQRNVMQHTEQVDNVAQDGYLFILMSMTEDDPLLEDTHAGIKCAAEQVGLMAERVDEIAFTGLITEKILSSIRCAEYIVADLTHERPNVYYELGYAHAFGKKTILTAREGTELHFDVRNYQVIFYFSRTQLEKRLKERLLQFERKKNHDTRWYHVFAVRSALPNAFDASQKRKSDKQNCAAIIEYVPVHPHLSALVKHATPSRRCPRLQSEVARRGRATIEMTTTR